MQIEFGSPVPLGASLHENGVNFAVFSEAASHIEICIFDENGEKQVQNFTLPYKTGGVFHGFVNGLKAGTLYGIRAYGENSPEKGDWFNPNKLLIDPYALEIDKPFALIDALHNNEIDSAAFVPKARIIAPKLAKKTIKTPTEKTIIYEMHVKGFTQNMQEIPDNTRGTFAGLCHPKAIKYLKELGINSIELLPIAAWIDERHLPPLGLSNYWGYNPICFMAPDPRLAPNGWDEVRECVETLSKNGIETILDVVFNHSGESDEFGPIISYRGLDNKSYYRINDDGTYANDAGCGNVLDCHNPYTIRLIMDALRAWVQFGGVAGFRFDLASVLGRSKNGFTKDAPLLTAISQDPILRECKLIAEPWDCGMGGYQIGQFPSNWGEWNDKYRDCMRGFWRGDDISLGQFATRFCGSQDIFHDRHPANSINFITAHDGFTLADLIAYEGKNNIANGENNRDGTDNNMSWNNGIEGPSHDLEILNKRRQDQKSLLAILLLSRGTPMLSMGSELGKSQNGNNNAYAQDNDLTYLDWQNFDKEILDFCQKLIKIRLAHPAIHANEFLRGDNKTGLYNDVNWHNIDGSPLSAHDWDNPQGQGLLIDLCKVADRILIAINRSNNTQNLNLPPAHDYYDWEILANSGDGDLNSIGARTIMVFGQKANKNKNPIPKEEEINRLCNALGIETSWWDVVGKETQVPLEAKCAIIKAMGYECDNQTQILQSLLMHCDKFERRFLPYSICADFGEKLILPICVGINSAPPNLWLNIKNENGEITKIKAANLNQQIKICSDGRKANIYELEIPNLEIGRYVITPENDILECKVTIAPKAAFLPECIENDGKVYGLTSQIYSLSRDGDQGIGDFTSLGILLENAAKIGVDIIGINPLHSLFVNDRERASPYYPSSRYFLEPLYLDLAKVPDIILPKPTKYSGQIDYENIWQAKLELLRQSFENHKTTASFEKFCTENGAALETFAKHQSQATKGKDSPEFFKYLQWLCDDQLKQATLDKNLKIGLCRDLAIGAAPDGAEIATLGDKIAKNIAIGAPPDPLGPNGQVWGLPPIIPHKMIESGFEDQIKLFASNMKYAGALRIDHAMGLMRQFWVPDGMIGASGAYVRFPFKNLLAELKLESQRAKCLIIGEDLGTVPHGFSEAMNDAHILSYRLMPFEKWGEDFKPASAYPKLSFACASTHDLPPLKGWWDALDIKERLEIGQFEAEEYANQIAQRHKDKEKLLLLLQTENLISKQYDITKSIDDDLIYAIHAFIAKTPAMIAIAQFEDLAGETNPINLPGTDKERPNWRNRLATSIDDIFASPTAQNIIKAMKR